MAQSNGILDKSFTASGSLETKQYHVVKMITSATPLGVTISSAATDILVGFLQNEPQDGEAAVVRLLGTTKAVVGTPITIGDRLTADANGKVVQAYADGDTIIGIALEGATASPQAIEVLIVHHEATV